jgi:hypothetical protein
MKSSNKDMESAEVTEGRYAAKGNDLPLIANRTMSRVFALRGLQSIRE